MADNITVKDANAVNQTVRTTDDAGVHTPHQFNATIGAQADSAAPSDGTGTYGVMSALKRVLLNGAALLSRVPVLVGGRTPVASANITTKFREAFETLDTATRWTLTTGTGDLVFVDGNCAAASYLVVSKSPWDASNETLIETQATFAMPVEIAFGAHISQRTVGQEFALELVSSEARPAAPADLAIATISQTTTVLTVTTVNPHGLSVGRCIGVRDVSNTLANYQQLVVATVPAPNQFTCTVATGTIGTINNSGFVYIRERFGRAANGVSQIFETTTATQATLNIRSESGDALPSGTIAGAQSATVGTTASVQLVNAPFQYAFAPTTEFRINVQADRVQWSDAAVDVITQTTNRLNRTQVCPDPGESYRFRLRAVNAKSLTVLNAKVVSVTKSGTTTGTFTTATAHGLTTGDTIVYYGSSNNVAANFPSLVTATAVTVTGATTFTAVIGTGTTGTAYGGVIAKVQGGNLLSALGANAITAINATLSTLADGTRQLVLTGSGNWAGLVIGDVAEVVGVTNVTNGDTLGVDGAWKVANFATTALTLVPATSAFAAGLPANFALTTSGGAVVKRTDLRLSFVRVFDYERERVEMLARPSGDISSAAPVNVQNSPAVTVSSGTVTTVTTAGTPAAPATPLIINSAASTNGQLVLTGTSGLQALYATNEGAAAAFVKLYNKATAPVVGTDVPAMVIPVPAAVGGVPGVAQIIPGFNGYRFALGLGLAITAGAADTDTAAVAAGQVKVILSRTV
jgi:hypothetical protein